MSRGSLEPSVFGSYSYLSGIVQYLCECKMGVCKLLTSIVHGIVDSMKEIIMKIWLPLARSYNWVMGGSSSRVLRSGLKYYRRRLGASIGSIGLT